MSRALRRARTGLALVSVLAGAGEVAAQAHPHSSLVVGSARNTTTVADARYRASNLHRWLLGSGHRDVWTTPVRVDVLDLRTTAGGLEPVEVGGGMQTRSLRLRGGDGREYAFRSVVKDPSALLDPLYRGTLVSDVVQDGISAAHPYGALVAAPLLEAAGVLHAEPALRVLPVDPSLGEFAEEFGGMLGILEERPDENEGGSASFRGAHRVIGSDRLTERLDAGPKDRVDAREYLRARLMDVFLGDFDRHRGQWRWATWDAEGPRRWLPVPRDRDQVFARFDGVAAGAASPFVPQFVAFGPEYGSLERLHWNSRAIDRWFLAELDADAWARVADEVRASLTDPVIADAVAHLPAEIARFQGAELTATLIARRDGLPAAARALYELMSRQVDVRATDEAEIVDVHRSKTGAVRVTLRTSATEAPYFQREFRPAETSEVRLYLRAGDDRVTVHGVGAPGITVRVVGAEGDDDYTLVDGARGILLYDHEGDNRVHGTDAPSIDTRPFDAWEWTPEDRNQPRDWGGRSLPLFWSGYGTDVGVFLGGGVRHERFGFRQSTFAAAFEVRAGYAPSLGTGRIEAGARFNRSNSGLFATARVRYSGVDVLHYYGLGNASAPGDEAFHRVDVGRASVQVGLGATPGDGLEVSGWVGLQRTRTGPNEGRFLSAATPVYGGGVFTAAGVGARVVFDPIGIDGGAHHRLRVSVEGVAHPRALDVEDPFGRVRGEVSALIAPATIPAVSLHLRSGAERVIGRSPWHESAFLGGNENLRGWSEQRFAGAAVVFAGGEVRVRALDARLLLPASVGFFGFADAGRVYVDGESPGGWRSGLGGGVLIEPAGQARIARIGFATSEESTKVFLVVGLPY